MTQILSHSQIRYKIERIAYQIHETHLEEETLILAGIEGNGYYFAEELFLFLQQISHLKVTMAKISLDKTNPLFGVRCNLSEEMFKHQNIVLVDDVLNSGLTLMYGVAHFLSVPVRQLKTAVLINRNHKKYPIKADFKGMSLSTSLCDNVEVRFDKSNYSVWLS